MIAARSPSLLAFRLVLDIRQSFVNMVKYMEAKIGDSAATSQLLGGE